MLTGNRRKTGGERQDSITETNRCSRRFCSEWNVQTFDGISHLVTYSLALMVGWFLIKNGPTADIVAFFNSIFFLFINSPFPFKMSFFMDSLMFQHKNHAYMKLLRFKQKISFQDCFLAINPFFHLLKKSFLCLFIISNLDYN